MIFSSYILPFFICAILLNSRTLHGLDQNVTHHNNTIDKANVKSKFLYTHGCKDFYNKEFTYSPRDVSQFKYAIVYIPFNTRLEEKAIDKKPTLYIQQPNPLITAEDLHFIYNNTPSNKNIPAYDKDKINFIINFDTGEKNEVVTFIYVHIPSKFVYETGLSSFEIHQVHPCTEKFAFISDIIYVTYDIQFQNPVTQFPIVTGPVIDEEDISGPHIMIEFGKSGFTSSTTKVKQVKNLNELSEEDFSDKYLTIVILFVKINSVRFELQPYYYPPLHNKKIINLDDIKITYVSTEKISREIVKKPIHLRIPLSNGKIPGFDPKDPVFTSHEVVERSTSIQYNEVGFHEFEFPQLVFSLDYKIVNNDIIVKVKDPVSFVKKNPNLIAYNVSYQKEPQSPYTLAHKYILIIDMAVPQSFNFKNAYEAIKVFATYPMTYNFISHVVIVKMNIVIDDTVIEFNKFPLVVRNGEFSMPSNRILVKCIEIGNEKIDFDEILVAPKALYDKENLAELNQDYTDILFFDYEKSKINDKKEDFIAELHLTNNSIYRDGTFKYNCMVDVPTGIKGAIGNTSLSYTIAKERTPEDMISGTSGVMDWGDGKTYYNVKIHSHLINRDQVKFRFLNSTKDIDTYRKMVTNDIYVLSNVMEVKDLNVKNVLIYVIIPFKYINDNLGHPVTIVPRFYTGNKLQGPFIEYIYGHNISPKDDLSKFTYDVEIISHKDPVKITHGVNVKKLYVILNGKGIKKEDVQVSYKMDQLPMMNKSKINIFIDFEPTEIGNIDVVAKVMIPHYLLAKQDDPTVVLIHDVDPNYGLSEKIRTITVFEEGGPEVRCSKIEDIKKIQYFTIGYDDTVDIVPAKDPRLYVFLKSKSLRPKKVKLFYKPYTDKEVLEDGTDMKIFVTYKIISPCKEEIKITAVVRGSQFRDKNLNPASLRFVYPPHIHGVGRIKQEFVFIDN
uniref:TMEM131_like domain-containing protein n=1 Tax=Strongyloides papillosus TaxID=174720 RepID=A0A0N5BRA3_STREA